MPLFFWIYLDGSASNDHGVASAGWGFLVIASEPIAIWEPVVPDAQPGLWQICSRWGSVLLNRHDPHFLGANRLTNNTGEYSAFGEALLWFILEVPDEIKHRLVSVFIFDSLMSGKHTTGDWLADPHGHLLSAAGTRGSSAAACV